VRATDGVGAAGQPVAANEEVVLEPGDLLTYVGLPADPGTFRNAGEESVSELVFGVWGSEVASCPPTGMVEPWLEYREGSEWTLSPGPLAFTLQRITLASAANTPLPQEDPDRALVILHAEEGVPTYEGDGEVRILTNAGDDPLVALLLTIRPVETGTATPVSDT